MDIDTDTTTKTAIDNTKAITCTSTISFTVDKNRDNGSRSIPITNAHQATNTRVLIDRTKLAIFSICDHRGYLSLHDHVFEAFHIVGLNGIHLTETGLVVATEIRLPTRSERITRPLDVVIGFQQRAVVLTRIYQRKKP